MGSADIVEGSLIDDLRGHVAALQTEIKILNQGSVEGLESSTLTLDHAETDLLRRNETLMTELRAANAARERLKIGLERIGEIVGLKEPEAVRDAVAALKDEATRLGSELAEARKLQRAATVERDQLQEALGAAQARLAALEAGAQCGESPRDIRVSAPRTMNFSPAASAFSVPRRNTARSSPLGGGDGMRRSRRTRSVGRGGAVPTAGASGAIHRLVEELGWPAAAARAVVRERQEVGALTKENEQLKAEISMRRAVIGRLEDQLREARDSQRQTADVGDLRADLADTKRQVRTLCDVIERLQPSTQQPLRRGRVARDGRRARRCEQ